MTLVAWKARKSKTNVKVWRSQKYLIQSKTQLNIDYSLGLMASARSHHRENPAATAVALPINYEVGATSPNMLPTQGRPSSRSKSEARSRYQRAGEAIAPVQCEVINFKSSGGLSPQ